ncbi:MAG: D-alanyl-D-alanine carboxypeptidase [Firmicutes bacterium]|nr:D-alanyl-D-alanine carboxypeptidase [Bacillota bacterium]
MRAKNIIIITILITQLLIIQVAQAEEPTIVGEAAILIDAENGQVLYEKNADKHMYPASTTKMLTAIVALERSNLNDVVTVSDNAAGTPGSSIWVKEGEQLTMEDMVYALMLNSANDVGVAIAEHISGNVEQFSLTLNEKAREIGAKNTHFTNPHGLPDEEHYTTARDLALIGRYSMQNAVFSKIVNTKTKSITRQDPDDLKYLISHNRLLWNYESTIGIKTGYTTKARQCIVAAASKDGRKLIAVVLKSQYRNVWTDAIKLFDYGFEEFEKKLLVSKGSIIDKTPVKYSEQEVPLLAQEAIYYNFPKEYQPQIKRKVIYQQEAEAPLKKGIQLAEVQIYDRTKQIATTELITAVEVERPSNTYWWYWVVPTVFLSLVLVPVVRFVWKLKSGKIRVRRRRK